MAITVTKNGFNITSQVNFPSLVVQQSLTNEVDTATFVMLSTADALLKEDGGFLLQEDGSKILLNTPPLFNDTIVISDGASVIFAGRIAKVQQKFNYPRQAYYSIYCVDHTLEMDRKLASRTFTNQSITAIIASLVSGYAPGFTSVNAVSSFVVPKIVFNQVPLSQCLRRLADIARYDWYVDENKDVHFFPASTNVAPFPLTDTTGSHFYKSLTRSLDSSQLVNRVRVRGGEYDGSSFTDTITVSGSATKSFPLPYQMANLVVEVDTGGGFVTQTLGVDFIDTFTDYQVLYNFQAQSFHFNTALAAGNKVRFTGNPKTPVYAVMEDTASVAQYGAIEKFIRDNSIKSNDVARKRAAAELMTYSDGVVDARFQTLVSGLRTGMQISVQTGGLGDSLLIKRMTFSARTPTVFQYDVECVSTQRYTLLDLLRKIITPDPLPTDENEVAQTLVPVSEEVTTTTSASARAVAAPLEIVRATDYLDASGGSSSATTFDGTGANCLVFVIPYTTGISGITYNGVAMTRDVAFNPGSQSIEIWRLNSPTTGVNAVSIARGTPGLIIQMRMYALKGINTSSTVAGTNSSNVSSQHKTLSVAQPNNVLCIGFMTVHVFDLGGGTKTYTPDAGDNVEDYEGVIDASSRPITVLHRIFSRSGTKTIGTNYSQAPTIYQLGEVMALYNGTEATP